MDILPSVLRFFKSRSEITGIGCKSFTSDFPSLSNDIRTFEKICLGSIRDRQHKNYSSQRREIYDKTPPTKIILDDEEKFHDKSTSYKNYSRQRREISRH